MGFRTGNTKYGEFPLPDLVDRLEEIKQLGPEKHLGDICDILSEVAFRLYASAICAKDIH